MTYIEFKMWSLIPVRFFYTEPLFAGRDGKVYYTVQQKYTHIVGWLGLTKRQNLVLQEKFEELMIDDSFVDTLMFWLWKRPIYSSFLKKVIPKFEIRQVEKINANELKTLNKVLNAKRRWERVSAKKRRVKRGGQAGP